MSHCLRYMEYTRRDSGQRSRGAGGLNRPCLWIARWLPFPFEVLELVGELLGRNGWPWPKGIRLAAGERSANERTAAERPPVKRRKRGAGCHHLEKPLGVEAGGTKDSIRAPGAALAPTIPQRMRGPKVAAQRVEHPSRDRQAAHLAPSSTRALLAPVKGGPATEPINAHRPPTHSSPASLTILKLVSVPESLRVRLSVLAAASTLKNAAVSPLSQRPDREHGPAVRELAQLRQG